MNTFVKNLTLISLAATISIGTSLTAYAALPSKETVTNTGISLKVPTNLNIVSPSSNTTTTAATYYIKGTSNPNQKLYINGSEITDRGTKGSFGVILNLAVGQNTVEVTQGQSSKKVVITRVASGSELPYSTTTALTSAFPTFENCVPAGTEMEVSCVAPAGATVKATINGKTITLKQGVESAKPGVAANFKAKYTMPDINSNVVNIGKVKYTMTYNGKTTTHYSTADLYTASKNSAVIVQNYENASPTYSKDTTNSTITTILAYGTVDRVIDQTDTLYRLSMGGWVPKKYFKPVEGNWAYKNEVADTFLRKDGNIEEVVFESSTFPGFEMNKVSGNLEVTLFNTTGVGSIPLSESDIFSSATAVEDGGNTVITFTPKTADSLWGYTIEYNSNETVLLCKKKPTLSGNANKPLAGITVAIDPGHGGDDPGALGTAGTTGPTESDLTLATSMAAKNMLESLGANVIMSRTTDVRVSYNDRMFAALLNRADFFISVHYNSTTYPSARGMEVYSFGENGSYLAACLQTNIANATGILSRGEKVTPFRMVLNTSCPTVLIESAFISNPREYDQATTDTWLYNMSVGIKNGIIASLM